MAKDTKVDEKDAIELSRPLKMDGVPRAGIEERIVAKPVEREALAKRLKIASLDRFEANITVEHEHGRMFTVKGGIFAELTQLCVVTTEPVKETVRDDFDLLMAPDYVLNKMDKKKGGETGDVEEAEPIPRGILDLGELASQYLAMAINPYPRVEGAAWEALSTEESAEQEIPKAVNPFLKLVKNDN